MQNQKHPAQKRFSDMSHSIVHCLDFTLVFLLEAPWHRAIICELDVETMTENTTRALGKTAADAKKSSLSQLSASAVGVQ